MANVTIYKDKKYYIEVFENTVDLYSTDSKMYPNIKGIDINEIKNACIERKWVLIRGCEALFNGIIDEFVLLDVRPSKDVEVLEAKEIDRGVYHARLPISEIESMWWERLPFLDFPFPEKLAVKEYIEIPNENQ